MIIEKSPEQLVLNEIKRQTLEEAALMLLKLSGNELYERAWRIAAAEIRSMGQRL